MMTLLALEVMGRIAYWVQFGERYSVSKFTTMADLVRMRPTRPVWMESQIQHPYFGATPGNRSYPQNRHPERFEDKYSIALFGGSVAAENGLALLKHIKRYFLERHISVEIHPVSFAVPGFKQPQQLIQLAYAISIGHQFDLIINLDGYNEAVLPIKDNYRRGVYPFYPRLWDLRVQGNDKLQSSKQDLQSLRRRLARIDEWYKDSNTRYSVYAGFAHRMQKIFVQEEMRKINVSLKKHRSTELEKTGPKKKYGSTEAVASAVVDNWYTSSLMMSVLAQRIGAEYYHFLQPNQYLDNSKVFTPEELNSAFERDHIRNEYIDLIYPQMRSRSTKFWSNSVRFHDLTQVFLNVEQTVYRDVCCHLNELGKELLARSIVGKMADTLASPEIRK